MSAIDFINFRTLNNHFGLCRSAIRKDKVPKRYKNSIKELEDLINYWILRNEKPIRPIRNKCAKANVRIEDVGPGTQPTIPAHEKEKVVPTSP